MSEPLTILLAISYAPVREKLIAAIEADPSLELVALTVNARRTIDVVEHFEPAVAIVQRRLAGFGSEFVLDGLAARECDTGVVVLSGYLGANEALRAVAAGADAVLSIDASAQEILAAARRAADGVVTLPDDVRERIAV